MVYLCGWRTRIDGTAGRNRHTDLAALLRQNFRLPLCTCNIYPREQRSAIFAAIGTVGIVVLDRRLTVLTAFGFLGPDLRVFIFNICKLTIK